MQPNPLNTTNSSYLTYSYEQIHFTVLGGIRLDTLNTMRATIKIQHYEADQRHTLDLYNNNALQRFAKSASEHLELGIHYILKATAALINELEAYRLTEMEKNSTATNAAPTLTEEEKQAAIAFLTHNQPSPVAGTEGAKPSPLGGVGGGSLLQRTSELLGSSGIIGEEINRLIMFIIFTSRKLNNPLHIISLASSGTGKSYLQEKVSQLIPDEDKKEITALSPNSFYYQGQTDLKHKLILLEDLTGAESSLYPIRELQSKKYIIKEISHKNQRGDTVSISKKVEGPVCIAACTTNEQIYEDNANRSFLIYLDDSEEQDQRIMNYQKQQAAGKIDKDKEQQTKHFMQNVQRVLKPITIKNPYAEQLELPQLVFKKRRANAHYLQFIEAITFYHQYQREEKHDPNTGEIYIETTPEDIQAANDLIKHILLRKSDELNGATRNYLELLKSYLKEKQQPGFSTKAVRKHYRINYNTQRMYMRNLIQQGYLHKAEGNKKTGFLYTISQTTEYSQLEQQVYQLLEQNYARVIQLNTVHPISKARPHKKAL